MPACLSAWQALGPLAAAASLTLALSAFVSSIISHLFGRDAFRELGGMAQRKSEGGQGCTPITLHYYSIAGSGYLADSFMRRFLFPVQNASLSHFAELWQGGGL